MNEDECIVLLTHFLQKTYQSLVNIENRKKAKNKLPAHLDNILDITSGLKIALSHRQSKHYA